LLAKTWVAMNTFWETAVFIHVGVNRKNEPWHFPAHRHTFHELLVILRGCQKTKMRGRAWTATGGEALLYAAGCAHEETRVPDGELETVFIGFHCADLPRNAPWRVIDARGRLRALSAWLVAERERRGSDYEAQTRALFQALLAEYFSLVRQDGATDLAARLRAYVETRMARPIALDDVARHLGMSKYHLIRRYRRQTGRTPMTDVARQRVERARDIVLTSSLPLKDIPEQVGLNDIYHMTRLFRRHLGTTPGGLRKAGHAEL
jgi:AraC-like DNA-binding protein